MADPYHLSPGSTSLLTLFGAEHSLGGITGYDDSWEAARQALAEDPADVGRLESKGSMPATAHQHGHDPDVACRSR